MSQKILHFKSSDISKGTTNNGLLNCDRQIDKNVNYELIEFVMSNSLYNVNNINNQIYFDETSVLKTATIVNGFYYPTDFGTAIKTAMDLAGANTYTPVFDSITGKFTITSTGNYGFSNLTNTDNSARILMGFDAIDQVEGVTQTSDNVIDLNPYKTILIKFQDDLNKHVESSKINTASLIISTDAEFLGVIRYKRNKNYSQYIKLSSGKQISFKFIDKDNNLIPLNGANWEMYLKRTPNL